MICEEYINCFEYCYTRPFCVCTWSKLLKSNKPPAIRFKGTVPRDFLPLVFFFKLFLLGPVDMPRNDLDFFRLFTEKFNYFGASLPVSLTPVNNSSPVSTTPVSDTFTVLESFTGDNDTGKKLLTSVIDTGEACIRWCQ